MYLAFKSLAFITFITCHWLQHVPRGTLGISESPPPHEKIPTQTWITRAILVVIRPLDFHPLQNELIVYKKELIKQRKKTLVCRHKFIGTLFQGFYLFRLLLHWHKNPCRDLKQIILQKKIDRVSKNRGSMDRVSRDRVSMDMSGFLDNGWC
jgi:hypothetical protein